MLQWHIRLFRAESMKLIKMDDNETKVAIVYSRIILLSLAVLVAAWQLDVEVPVIP